jgi:hypothetical protein
MNLFVTYLPFLFLAAAMGLGLRGVHWLLIGRHRDLGSERPRSRRRAASLPRFPKCI